MNVHNGPPPDEANQASQDPRSSYQRKKADKFDRLVIELEALHKVLRTVPEKDFPKLAGMSKTIAQKKIASFRSLLTQALSYPVAYSFLLQECLHGIGLRWPEGVFITDFESPGSGRKPSDLGLDALGLHEARKFGWRKVARTLIPEEYRRSPDAAVAKVYKAAERALDQRTCLLTELKNLTPGETRKELALKLRMHAESHYPHDRRRMSLEERLEQAAKWPEPFVKTKKRRRRRAS